MSAGAAGSNAGAPAAGAPAAGAASLAEVARALDGLRLEDPCGDTPADNHTCKHVGSAADSDAFADAKSALIGGTAGSS